MGTIVEEKAERKFLKNFSFNALLRKLPTECNRNWSFFRLIDHAVQLAGKIEGLGG